MNKKTITLITTYLTMLAGSATIQGQHGVLLPEKQAQEITPRRGDGAGVPGYINTPENVNNEFGAGESATIFKDGSDSKATDNLIGIGGTGNVLNSTPVSTIQLGSTQSQNIVIRSYSGDGYASGWISVLRVADPFSVAGSTYPTQAVFESVVPTNGTVGTPPSPATGVILKDRPYYVLYKDANWMLFSFNKFNASEFQPPYSDPSLTTTKWAQCNTKLFESSVNGNDVKVWHHEEFPKGSGDHREYQATVAEIGGNGNIYTSIRDSVTSHPTVYLNNTINRVIFPVDEVDLLQFNGGACVSSSELANQTIVAGAPKSSKLGTPAVYDLINYRRPTTVAVQGENSFNQIKFDDVEWWYTKNIAKANLEDYDASYNTTGPRGSYRWICYSGLMGPIEYSVSWSIDTVPGATKLDAAVQLIDGSETCVANSISDNTGNIAELPSTDSVMVNRIHTNALITVPFYDRYTLRTAGNFYANIDNERDSVTSRRILYGQLSFPDPDKQVYLMPSTSNSTTYRPGYSLIAYNNSGDINAPAPYNKTKASLFGVYGAYDFAGQMANIHTLSSHDENAPSATHPSNTTAPGTSAAGDNNHGVIEVGTGFALGTISGTTGYDKFHIYSGGTVKNFEGLCNGPSDNYEMNFTTSDNTPVFYLDADEPTYILNFGNNGNSYWNADINFKTDGITRQRSAFTAAKGDGAMHIQARGDVKFIDKFDPTISKKNELRLLSDQGSVQLIDEFLYTNGADTNVVIWAKGSVPGDHSCVDDTTIHGSGVVFFGKKADIKQNGNTAITLIRSEYDDVIMKNTFDYTNAAGPDNGEFMMQAGQDIYGLGTVTFAHNGQKSILMEAQRTIHLKDILNFTRGISTQGDITLKAGYAGADDKYFSPTADVVDWTPLDKYACTLQGNNYVKREPCNSEEGADIWLEGATSVLMTAGLDSIATTLRAFNSIYLDNTFAYTRTGSGDNGGKGATGTGRTLLFAETGNIEAIKGGGGLTFTLGAKDSSALMLQAGNNPDNKCSVPTQFLPSTNCWITGNTSGAEYDGNILLNNPLNVANNGTGNLLISSARDIETQTGGTATFTFAEAGKNSGDILITGGRHVETHAAMTFNHTIMDDTAMITIEAGRLNEGYVCSKQLCKVSEYGTILVKSDSITPIVPTEGVTSSPRRDNFFAEGGAGNGSILAFNPITFNYKGMDTILMTALNGNIETDPYLHGTYPGEAKVEFNHQGKGIVRMEAIDIKLHDVLEYKGTHHTSDSNGWFYMAAFDSILTRDLTYTNKTDNGSVYVTTDKYKNLVAGGCSGSITQGHIVLGYGASTSSSPNANDQILFDFGGSGNTSATGANLYIRAGYEGFAKHATKKNQYGGNITYDYLTINAASGNHKTAGYTELSTPNGNIWGKDFMDYTGFKGDLSVDAGKGSVEDDDAIAWTKGEDGANTTPNRGMNINILNTSVPKVCSADKEWRTGNIMMKGGSLNFDGDGNATFRTREGYIDTYDAFDVNGMKGQLLKYAHAEVAGNQYGDVSERDFVYTPAGGSVYYGADDNVMFNYGNSNGTQNYTNNITCAISGDYAYDGNALHAGGNPYYSTLYGNSKFDADYAKFNVNTNGYLFYKTNYQPINQYHYLYRGGHNSCLNSGLTGTCATPSNGARDMTMDFSVPNAGGFAAVANNYIDFFTKFTYKGGQGNGMVTPTVGTIINESVTGYGLLLKSRHEGVQPEARRVTCYNCTDDEWPSVTFHDDARIHTEGQISVLEGPVIEFFGHAELDAYSNTRSKSKLTVKADSLIFHDSAVFDGSSVELLPFTTSDRGMRHGVVNDANYNMYKEAYGQAISMHDRQVPVLELGYQRCNEPNYTPNSAANRKDVARVGGDVIVAAKNGFDMPIFNTVVANHARISFIDDMIDGYGNVYRDANVRTDLLRIRNKVEFYTDPSQPDDRRGVLKMTSDDQMPTQRDAGIYPRRIHMEPGSELSIPGEDSLTVISTTVVGGYGEIHENIMVKANGVIAPGYASMMECDCTSGCYQGKMTIHNLSMEKDAQMRISISKNNCQRNPATGNNDLNCTQTDTLYVQDSIFFVGKIPLYVLTEDTSIDPGCYLFLKYDDTLGVSMERAKNLVLEIKQYGDRYFSLVHSRGEVRLCVSTSPDPIVRHYIEIPAITGVTTTPNAGTHYVEGQQHFTLTAAYTGAPYKVIATSTYSKQKVELLGEKQSDGSYKYELRYVVEPWTLAIGPDYATDFVDNDIFGKPSVWAYGNTLYIKMDKKDIASIYSMTGVLQQRVEIPEGQEKITLDRGIYVVTLSDGSVHKIIIK